METILTKVKKDKALKKTITYRLLVGAGGAAIVYLFTGNLLATAGVSVSGEVFRSGVYYIHEKWWEKQEETTKETTQQTMPKEWREHI